MTTPLDAVVLHSERSLIGINRTYELLPTLLPEPAYVSRRLRTDAVPVRSINGIRFSESHAVIAVILFAAPLLVVAGFIQSARRAAAIDRPPLPRIWPPGPDPRFATKVSALERMVAIAPRRYSVQVLAAAALGFVALATTLLLALVWIGAVGYLTHYGYLRGWFVVLAASPALVLALTVLRACRLRTPPVEGPRLTREDAPGLWQMLDDVCARLGTEKVSEVVLTGDMQASVIAQPRLGIFGWPRIIVCIGLPLTLLLSKDQVKAIIAHEIGHTDQRQRRMHAWIYRTRQTWAQLQHQLLVSQPWGSTPLLRFLSWYVPWFEAHSFVMARNFEYLADAAAADIAGKHAAASALTSTVVLDQYLTKAFWKKFVAQADHAPEPPSGPNAAMAAMTAAPIDAAEIQRCFDEALEHETAPDSTHPSLKDRLHALGIDPALPGFAVEPAAAHLFGGAAGGDSLIGRIDETWLLDNKEPWRQRYERQEAERKELEELDAREQPLSTDASLRRAALIEQHFGMERAEPVYRELVDREPDNAPAIFAMGRAALARGEDGGLSLLDRAMELDAHAVVPGCSAALDYLIPQKRFAEAEPYVRRYDERSHLLALADRERGAPVTRSEPLHEPGLPSEKIEAIAAMLQAESFVRRAYLVRRKMRYLPDQLAYVVVLRIRTSGMTRQDIHARLQHIADNAGLPNVQVLRANLVQWLLWWRLWRMKTALIFTA